MQVAANMRHGNSSVIRGEARENESEIRHVKSSNLRRGHALAADEFRLGAF